DWVESCTALVEHFDGRIELIDWIEQGAATAAPTADTSGANGDRDRLAA
ncbi:MAG: UDP-2,3-diacylglucosamine diphosphatase, partial [Pseudomonadota bacterium]|nr:UDP-2,3-diacylglucosamine diphosphatase [Pseudomonadota bacterium]